MTRIIILGRGGAIDAERVVAILPAKSQPVKDLLRHTDPARVLNLTYGFPRRAVIVLDNGFLAVVSRTPAEVAHAVSSVKEFKLEDKDPPAWW